MNTELMLEELDELSKNKEENLRQIEMINDEIDDCQKKSRQYALMIFTNNHNIELYRNKSIILKKTIKPKLTRLIYIANEKIKIVLLEKENQRLETNRVYYQNRIISYQEEKNELENENISLGNRIFIINDTLNNNENQEKKLIKEAK